MYKKAKNKSLSSLFEKIYKGILEYFLIYLAIVHNPGTNKENKKECKNSEMMRQKTRITCTHLT